MKTTFAVVASLSAVALAAPKPQGVTDIISPTGSAPEGCQTSYSGSFQLGVVAHAAKRQAVTLEVTLENSVLKDQQGRTAYIADNYQFQFDAPPQTGALTTAGYSVCGNGSLALGSTTVFWSCNSGELNNIYDRKWAEQCTPIHLQAQGGAGSQPPSVTQIPDGQPQNPPGVTQIPDGQPQAPPAVTQIPDGQPQAPPAAPPVTQIPDGQPQAPPAAPPVTQIPDGQPQAPPAAPPVTQIPDGQPQAPPAAPPVTQIPDGQPQAPPAATNTPPPFTGAASAATAGFGAFAAAILGAVALL